MPVQRRNVPIQNDLVIWPYLKPFELPELDVNTELLIGTNELEL